MGIYAPARRCAFYLFIRQPMGRKSALRREIPWILRGFQGPSKLLICGLFLKGRVLAQDGVQNPGRFNVEPTSEPVPPPETTAFHSFGVAVRPWKT